jgi:hypothetical protein
VCKDSEVGQSESAWADRALAPVPHVLAQRNALPRCAACIILTTIYTMRADGTTGALLDAVVKPVGSRESKTWTRHLPTLGLTGLTLLLLVTYAILWSGGKLQGGDSSSSSITGAKRGGAHAGGKREQRCRKCQQQFCCEQSIRRHS